MSKICPAVAVVVVLATMAIATAVESSLNHNSVLITGDTPSGGGDDDWSWDGESKDRETYDEFWNDTYLMWELLWKNECYDLHGTAPDSDHIHVCYGDSQDYDYATWRYDPWIQISPGLQITDYGAYKHDVRNIFNWLAHGGNGIDSMTQQDNLYCWTFGHGYHTEPQGFTYLWLMDSTVRADKFAEWTDQIASKTKTFWMQQCCSGGFIDDLADSNTVILTAAGNGMAWAADDDSALGSPWPENEVYLGDTCHHGEFNFHTMNCVRGEALYPYGNPPTVDADSNGDLLVSMRETFRQADLWNTTSSTFQYSDSGGIGDSLFLGWDDYTPPSTPAALVDSCTCTDTTMYVILNWNDNTEQDLVGYRVYRNDDRIASLHESRHSDYDVEEMVYRYDVSAFDVANNESQLHRVRLSLICGDPKPDGVISVSDANYLVSFIYRGGPEPACPPASYSCCGDVNVDGRITIADATYIIDYIYRGGPPPCEPEGRSSSGEYAQAGLSRLTTDEDVAEITVLAQFDVPIAGVHLGITYDAETIDMLDPAVTSRSEGLELFYDLNLTRGYLSLGMLDLKGQNYIERGDGAILTLRLRGERGSPDLKSVCLEEVVFVDMDSRTLQTEILNGCGPSGGSQGASLSGGTSMRFVLAQNSPNPFSSGTSIEYVIPTSSHVVLTVYDISGKAVETLVDGTQTSGFHSVQWDGRDGIGGRVAAGVYFYKLTADEFTSVKKMVLLR